MVKISIVIIFSPQVEFVPDFAEGFRKMLGKPDNELRGFVFQKLFLLVAGEVREAQVFVFLPASDTEITAVKISVCHLFYPHKKLLHLCGRDGNVYTTPHYLFYNEVKCHIFYILLKIRFF